jgi:hypothetical protein
LQDGEQGWLVEDAGLADSVQEQSGSAVYAVLDAGDEVLPHPFDVRFLFQFAAEAIDVQLQLLGVLEQVPVLQCILVFEEKIVHLPETALRGGGFGGFRSHLRVLMNSGQGIVPVHKTKASAEFLLHTLQGAKEKAAVGALIVPVFD